MRWGLVLLGLAAVLGCPLEVEDPTIETVCTDFDEPTSCTGETGCVWLPLDEPHCATEVACDTDSDCPDGRLCGDLACAGPGPSPDCCFPLCGAPGGGHCLGEPDA